MNARTTLSHLAGVGKDGSYKDGLSWGGEDSGYKDGPFKVEHSAQLVRCLLSALTTACSRKKFL